MSKRVTGGCLCRGVEYEICGPLREVIACHCAQCRRTSGHHVAATACRRKYFQLLRQDTLRWYVAKPGFRRGFCSLCGSNLFFEESGGERVSVAAGSLDEPQGLKVAAHIFTSEAGDYYEIGGNAPRSPDGRHSVSLPG